MENNWDPIIIPQPPFQLFVSVSFNIILSDSMVRNLSVNTDVFNTFFLSAYIKLSFKIEYGFCPKNDNQCGRDNNRHLSVLAVLVVT